MKTRKQAADPIRMNLKTYIKRKVAVVTKLPAKESKAYDTTLTWAFVWAVWK